MTPPPSPSPPHHRHLHNTKKGACGLWKKKGMFVCFGGKTPPPKG
ncbi:hypothetical protein Tco_0379880, partial [Tanacetum coccineum]